MGPDRDPPQHRGRSRSRHRAALGVGPRRGGLGGGRAAGAGRARRRGALHYTQGLCRRIGARLRALVEVVQALRETIQLLCDRTVPEGQPLPARIPWTVRLPAEDELAFDAGYDRAVDAEAAAEDEDS